MTLFEKVPSFVTDEERKARKRARDDRYREANRDKIAAYRKAYREANREKISAAQKKCYQARREEIAVRSKAYREANREKTAARNRTYREKNPVLRTRSANNKARACGAEGRIATGDVRAQFASQNGLCFYCGVKLSKGWHIDHKTPLSRGGSNWPENICCACPKCNHRKHVKTSDEFFLQLLEDPLKRVA